MTKKPKKTNTTNILLTAGWILNFLWKNWGKYFLAKCREQEGSKNIIKIFISYQCLSMFIISVIPCISIHISTTFALVCLSHVIKFEARLYVSGFVFPQFSLDTFDTSNWVSRDREWVIHLWNDTPDHDCVGTLLDTWKISELNHSITAIIEEKYK